MTKTEQQLIQLKEGIAPKDEIIKKLEEEAKKLDGEITELKKNGQGISVKTEGKKQAVIKSSEELKDELKELKEKIEQDAKQNKKTMEEQTTLLGSLQLQLKELEKVY